MINFPFYTGRSNHVELWAKKEPNMSLLFTQFLDVEKQLDHLEDHLNSIGKSIRRVARDGLCVLRSVQEVLKEKSITLSLDELKAILRQEVSESNYSHFACPDDPVSGSVNHVFTTS